MKHWLGMYNEITGTGNFGSNLKVVLIAEFPRKLSVTDDLIWLVAPYFF